MRKTRRCTFENMKKIKKINRIILVAFLAVLFIVGVYLTGKFPQPVGPEYSETAHGSSDDNVTGWAWGGGDDLSPVGNPEAGNGWISFNCYNDYDNDGVLEDNCAPDYGVNINENTGGFSGEAWVGGGEEGGVDVPMLGWLSFDRSETGNPPAAPFDTGDPTDSIASLDFQTGQVFGWMKALAADGTGWDGWIKLGGDTGGTWPTYGGEQVSVNLDTKRFCGWAWGSDVVGWVSFNVFCDECDDDPFPDGDGVVDDDAPAGCAPPGTPMPPFPIVDINFSPKGSELNPVDTFYYCKDSLHPKLSWTYSDPDNVPPGTDPQTAYHIQIDVEGSSDFEFPLKLEKIAYTDSTTYTVIEADMVDDDLEWNTTYYWRIKVKDSDEHSSDWSSVVSFTTPFHAYPDVLFSYAPNQPSAEENVSFRDLSTCYDSTTYIEGRECTTVTFGDSYNWTFTLKEGSGDVNWDLDKGDALTLENPVVSFSDKGKWEVKLRVTDGNPEAYSCETPPPYEIIIVREPLPWWREIIPR